MGSTPHSLVLARKGNCLEYIFYDYHKLFTQNFNNLGRAAAKCLQVFYTPSHRDAPKDLCRVTTCCRIWCLVLCERVYVGCLFCLPASQPTSVWLLTLLTANTALAPPNPAAKLCEHKQLLRRIIAIKVRLKWAERPWKRAGFIGLDTWQWSVGDGLAFMHKYEYQYFTTCPIRGSGN